MGCCGGGFPSQVADNFDEEIIFHPHKEALLFFSIKYCLASGNSQYLPSICKSANS